MSIFCKIPIENNISKPILNSQQLLFIEKETLKAYDISTGKQIWEKNYKSNSSIGLTIHNHHLITYTKDHYLLSINSLTGALNWKSKTKLKLTHPPVINETFIYVTQLNQKGNHELKTLTLNTGTPIWSYKNPLLDLNITSSPSIGNNLIILPATITAKNLSGEKNTHAMLFALDSNSGKLQWEQPYKGGYDFRPILTNSTVFVNSSEHNQVTVFDSLTGAHIPLIFSNNSTPNPEPTPIQNLNLYKSYILKLINNNGEYKLVCES